MRTKPGLAPFLCARYLDNAQFLAPTLGPELFRTELSKNAYDA